MSKTIKTLILFTVLTIGVLVWGDKATKVKAEGTCECRVVNSLGACGINTSTDNCTDGSVPRCLKGHANLEPNQGNCVPCECIAPTPTLVPPIPAPDCGTCAAGCNTGCIINQNSTGPGCNCIPDTGTLSCNQECSPLTGSQCAPECGRCAVPIGSTFPDYRCVNSSNGITPDPTETEIPDYDPCAGMGEQEGACRDCLNEEPGQRAWTAIGCISTSPTNFAAEVMKILFGIAGGIAFLLMLYGAFICITSKGDPQKAQACKETITSAIIGLLMLIFALAIVRIIFGPTSDSIFPGLVNIF